jgi:predicted peptidase
MRRISTTWVGVVLVLLLPTVVLAADPNQFLAGTYTDSGTGLQLPYRLFVPLDYNPLEEYPLVLFLHGSGETGTDNTSQLSHVDGLLTHAKMPAYSSFLLAPQTNSGWSSTVEQMTLSVIDQLQTQYSIDSNRRYVTGLSMGGYGTWDMISRYPDRFAAAVPICGGGDITMAPLLVDEPIWAFHNAGDMTVSVSQSREMIEAISAAGGTPRYTEYPKNGHNAYDPAYSEPELYVWMYGQGVAESRQGVFASRMEVPEPTSLALMLGGVVGMGGCAAWRRFRKQTRLGRGDGEFAAAAPTVH